VLIDVQKSKSFPYRYRLHEPTIEYQHSGCQSTTVIGQKGTITGEMVEVVGVLTSRIREIAVYRQAKARGAVATHAKTKYVVGRPTTETGMFPFAFCSTGPIAHPGSFSRLNVLAPEREQWVQRSNLTAYLHTGTSVEVRVTVQTINVVRVEVIPVHHGNPRHKLDVAGDHGTTALQLALVDGRAFGRGVHRLQQLGRRASAESQESVEDGDLGD